MTRGRIFAEKHLVNLKMMLEGGQCFRWKEITPNKWIGTAANTVWTLYQNEGFIEYEVHGSLHINIPNKRKKATREDTRHEEILRSYLRLDAPLNKYYEEWSRSDANFKYVSKKCYGIRILNQEPIENVFSFICSSNNNIKRISSLVEKLCKMYGTKICEVHGVEYYGFPELSALAACEESDLRKAGFGYRAKFIHQSAKQIQDFGGVEWLEGLKKCSYAEAKSELIKLSGIGAKVADCICLMSLGHMEAVPVDTHVYQIACQSYLPHLKQVKNVTDRIYNEIGDFFRNLYGPLAGWAHTILFCGDLKAFKDSKQPQEEVIDPFKILPHGNICKTKEGICKYVPNETKKKSLDEEGNVVSGALICSRNDLNLRITLNSGQTFRFKEIGKDVWRGVLGSKVWTFNQFDDSIEFTAHFPLCKFNKKMKTSNSSYCDDSKLCEMILNEYFRLDVPLAELYDRWAKSDKHFQEISENFSGLRMIKQDIVENLFAFICSSCNTIDRMSSMVESMCNLYGGKLAEVDGVEYYDFPSIEKLADPSVVSRLHKSSFGYRAKYVQQAAEYIVDHGGDIWIQNLKDLPYEEAKLELMKLPGVASKVADCICLTALDHLETIPVDTHVFKIAKKYYLPHLMDKKSVSSKAYDEIGTCFRNLFGHYSGWAHTVLFCADLKQHQQLHSLQPVES